jgi:glycosyltransferase involved in cell wall biosynthesis
MIDGIERLKSEPQPESDGPLIAICMATYNPPPELFRRQIESIVAQTHRNWVCVISDDASQPESLAKMENVIRSDSRFILSVSPERLGFYHNFERCLSMVPDQAEFVALSDQDDFWYPHKLSALLSRFGSETTLVYSDMRIVTAQGELIADTYWQMRRNSYANLASLLLANTVTGAASIFRRQLLSYILPFPPRVGELYHDHWIAGVALALGDIAYVASPLYDYLQHPANVIGHNLQPRASTPRLIYYLFTNFATAEGREQAKRVYFEVVLKVVSMARALTCRCNDETTWKKRRALRRLSRLDNPFIGGLWLALRGLKEWSPTSPTFGAEYHLLLGVVWKLYFEIKSRLARLLPNVT